MTKAKPKERGLNPELERYLNDLMKKAQKDPDMSLTDRMKIVDRVLKFEQLRIKMTDDGFGTGFHDDDD